MNSTTTPLNSRAAMRRERANLVRWLALAGAAVLILAASPARGQAPVIESLSHNGALVCTNLVPGTTATVEWAPTATGPWTNSWEHLAAVTVDTNGAIRVNVPMFYRVRGEPAPAPPGMALIPAGSFTMGDSLDGDSRSLPLRTVYVSGFYMDKYEVTKALWDEVRVWALTNGYSFDNAGSGKATNHPVHTVNWYDCVKWSNVRSEKAGLVPAYYTSAAQKTVYRTGRTNVQNEWVKWSSCYRLPTEAEWEKAARGGASGQRFPWGNTITHSNANYWSSSSYAYDVSPTRGYHPSFQSGGTPYTSPVDYFAPNGYGLYDMSGNVWQWCWDWYGSYSAAPATDPRGPSGVVSDRVLRCGGWLNYAFLPRCASRNYSVPGSAYYSIGFRCVRGL